METNNKGWYELKTNVGYGAMLGGLWYLSGDDPWSIFELVQHSAQGGLFCSILGYSTFVLSPVANYLAAKKGLFSGFNRTGGKLYQAPQESGLNRLGEYKLVNGKSWVFNQTLAGTFTGTTTYSRRPSANMIDSAIIDGNGAPPGSDYIRVQATGNLLRKVLKRAGTCQNDRGKSLSERTLKPKIGTEKYWLIRRAWEETERQTGFVLVYRQANGWPRLNYDWYWTLLVILATVSGNFNLEVSSPFGISGN
jgi:hypothetical protein